MTRTARLLQRGNEGFQIVVAGGPVFHGREDGRWPVTYRPRYSTDPRPFLGWDSGFRYAGGELEAVPGNSGKSVEWDRAVCPECGSWLRHCTCDE
jgi:hypothetical protein